MIEFVISFINARLTALNFFGEINGLAELLQKEETVDGSTVTKIFPAIYCDNGNYKYVDDLSTYQEGLCYHRILGESTEDGENESVTACDKSLRQVTNMRLVALVPKKIFENKNDNEFIDQKVLQNIKNAIFASNQEAIADTLQVDIVSIQVVSSDTDRYAVFAEEFDEVKFNIGLEYIFLSVDYDVAIEASQACFQDFDCDGLTPPVFCEATVIDGENPDSPITLENSETYTCLSATPVDELTCAQLNAQLTQPQRILIQRVEGLRTGQTTSFAANDDGAREDGRGTSFLTLDCNNIHGNTSRFTDRTGNATPPYASGIAQDHLTRLEWNVAIFAGNWTTVLAAIAASVVGGNSDWFLSNNQQLISILDFSEMISFNGLPMQNQAANFFIYTSTTDPVTTTNAYVIQTNNHILTRIAKTGAGNPRGYACRKF